MNDLERRVRGAFDEVELPAEVKARTLDALDELGRRASEYSLLEDEAEGAVRACPDGSVSAPRADESREPACMPREIEGSPSVDESNVFPNLACSPEMEADDARNSAFARMVSLPETAASKSPEGAPPVQGGIGSSSLHVSARRTSRGSRWRYAAVALAACFALAVVGVVGARLYFDETAYVGIDVNPSIELGINRFDIVVSATALNEDGEALLQEAPVVGKRYDDAVRLLTSSAAFMPYLQADAFVEISVTAANARQSDDLRQQSDACLGSLPCEGESQAVDAATRDAALAAGMGAGRYRAALQLIELDPGLTLEDCAAMSMRELRDCIAAASKGTSSESGDEDGSGGRGQGKGQGQGYGPGMGAGGQNTGGGQGPSGRDDAQGTDVQQGGQRRSPQGSGRGAGGQGGGSS